MTDPAFPPPGSTPSHDPDSLHLACPACSRELILDASHVGVPGFCPECHVPIMATRTGLSGEVVVQRVESKPDEANPSQLAPPPPPLPSVGGTVLQTKSGIFVEARQLNRRVSPVLIGLLVLIILTMLLAAAGLSLRRSGRFFDFARPEKIIPVPVPLASAPMEIPSPGVTPPTEQSQPESDPTPPQTPATPAPAPPPEPAPPSPEPPRTPPDPRHAALAAAAETTLRAFLTAERPWEKLTHVLEPEEDLLSILDFQKLDPVAADAPVRQLEVLAEPGGRRWISLVTVPERDGSLRTFSLIHRAADGEAKVDFSLYWQNRSDVLKPFVEGGPDDEPLTARVELRRLPADPGGGVKFAIQQVHSSFPSVEISVPASLPLAAELSARISPDAATTAIVELVWTAGESQPVPTIGRVIQWGIWSAGD